jgi:hypothetical protein
MYTIFIESNDISNLEFKDSNGKPVLQLNVVKPGADEVPVSAIYLATKEEMQVVAYLVDQKYGDKVRVKQASDTHNRLAISEISLVGKFMNGDVLAEGDVLFEAINKWKEAGVEKVSLCFFNPVALTFPDGMEHLVHTSILSIVNAIRSAELEVSYTLIAPLNVEGVYNKVKEHFGDDVHVRPIPASLGELKAFDGVWDLSSISSIDNSSEVVLDLLGVPMTDIKETNNDSDNTKSTDAVPENSTGATISIWIQIWRKVLRMFGIRL